RESRAGVGAYGREVAHRASADAVPGALRHEDLVEEGLDLAPGVPGRVAEDRRQGAGFEPLQEAVEDGVAEILLGSEVVVEVTLSSTTLTEDVVERGPMVPPDRHQPGRHLEDLLLDGRSTHLGVPTGRYTSACTTVG